MKAFRTRYGTAAASPFLGLHAPAVAVSDHANSLQVGGMKWKNFRHVVATSMGVISAPPPPTEDRHVMSGSGFLVCSARLLGLHPHAKMVLIQSLSGLRPNPLEPASPAAGPRSVYHCPSIDPAQQVRSGRDRYGVENSRTLYHFGTPAPIRDVTNGQTSTIQDQRRTFGLNPTI